MLIDLTFAFVDLVGELVDLAVPCRQLLHLVGERLFEAINLLSRLLKFLDHCLRAGRHGRPLLAQPAELCVQLPHSGRLMPDRRFVARHGLSVCGNLTFDLTKPVVHPSDVGIEGCQTALKGFLLLVKFAAFAFRLGNRAFTFGQPGRKMTEIVSSQAEPHLAQLLRDVTILGGFGRLAACRIELRFDFIHDVREPQQVLRDPFQLAKRLGLAGLVAADPGSFLENGSTHAGVRLQDLVDPSLFDDAVRRRGRSGSHEQIADVAQPG